MTISEQEATHHRDSDPHEALQWINVTYERLLLRIPEPENEKPGVCGVQIYSNFQQVRLRKWVLR